MIAAGLLPMEILVSTMPDRPPVDVDKIARDLGITVLREDLGRNISGSIARDRYPRSPARYTIKINSTERPRRQRFTLAHEIAHYIMHRDLIGDGITDDAMYRSRLADHYERQANFMAANILMPANLVRARYRELPAIAPLAAEFDVSPEAMGIRIRELRLGR